MKEKEIISKVRIYDYEELSEADRELIDKAKEATQTSYAPFSKFCVGAAARLSDGRIVTGSNQENAAFPSSLCAERTVLRQRTLPREKRGRTGHCRIRPRGFLESSHPSLRSLPASHSRSRRTVRTSRTHPAVRRRGYLRGRFGQSPTPLAVYRRNHERIKYFSYLCRKYSIQGII